MKDWSINFLYRDNKPKSPRPGSFYYITKTDKGLWFAPDDILSHMVRLDNDINVGEIEKIISGYVIKNLYNKEEIDKKLDDKVGRDDFEIFKDEVQDFINNKKLCWQEW